MSHGYTFILPPGEDTRYLAGPYDPDLQSPNYQIEIDSPEHVGIQVEVVQLLMGSHGNYIWAWDITNKSRQPALITIKKDGVLVKNE